MLTCHGRVASWGRLWPCPESRAGPVFNQGFQPCPLAEPARYVKEARKLAMIQKTWLPEGNCHLNTRKIKLQRRVELQVESSSPWNCYGHDTWFHVSMTVNHNAIRVLNNIRKVPNAKMFGEIRILSCPPTASPLTFESDRVWTFMHIQNMLQCSE